jgi:transposase
MAAIANQTNLEIRRGDLTEEQWEKLKTLLPPQKAKTGRPGHDHRQIINGILWILRTGAPWRDLPDCYGVHSTVSSRFYRWRKAGIWDDILAKLQMIADGEGKIDWEVQMGDSTVVRAHQHAAGAKGGKKSKL